MHWSEPNPTILKAVQKWTQSYVSWASQADHSYQYTSFAEASYV